MRDRRENQQIIIDRGGIVQLLFLISGDVCLLTHLKPIDEMRHTAAAAVYMIMCGSFKGKEEANDVMETNIIKCR